MSTVLKLKRSGQSGNAPDTSNIVEGELALNTADKILYSRGGSTIFQIGANITESFTVNPGTAADTITLGATAQEGTITLGQSTATNTINIGNAVTANAATQTINIGGGNASGGDTVLNLAANTNTASNTAVTIGCSNGTGSHTVAIRGASTFSNGAVAFNGGNFTVNPNSTSDTINIGKITGTGTITLGKSTKDNTINIGNATTESDQEQIINIGSGTGSGTSTVNIAAKNSQGSDTAVRIGGNDVNSGTSTVAIRGNTTFQYGTINFNGDDFTITPVLATREITLGSTAQTGTITLGRSTASQNISIGSGATTVTNAGIIDIGCNLASGGVKTVNICAGTGNSGSRNVNINSTLQSTGQNYLNGATKIRRTSGVPLIVESTSTSTNTTSQGLQLLNTNTTSFFKFGNFSSLAQVQSYWGSGSPASIQFIYGQQRRKTSVRRIW